MILEAKNITATYNQAIAITNTTFKVNDQEIVALLGPNGAGKSTALKALSGILKKVGGDIISGDILLDGKSILNLQPYQRVNMGISLIPEGRHIFPTMTVYENLELGAFLIRDPKAIKKNMDRVLSMFPSLLVKLSLKSGALSGGEQQMLSLGRSLMLTPKILLIDEPSLGLSPNYVEIILNKLIEIKNEGTGIILVEQNISKALAICNRAYVFEMGRITMEGTPNYLKENSRLNSLLTAHSNN